MNSGTTAAPFTVEGWDEAHLRWAEFVRCLEQTAPEQAHSC